LAGIHPRNIPEDLHPEAVRDLVMPCIEHDLCLGIGEIGLEMGTAHEEEIFQAQLEVALELHCPELRLGVHTPRSNKAVVTHQTLAIIEKYPRLNSLLVMDHCSTATLPEVLGRDLFAGVTLSPPKTTLGQLTEMRANHAWADRRVMCNTDSGLDFYEDLVKAASSQILPLSARRQLFQENAARFFGLKIDDSGVVVRCNRG
jgi:predicted metal-dependent TIM-barrel fold hydrolase